MSEESVKAEDELTLVLLDKDGKVKQTNKQEKTSLLERLLEIISRMLILW